MSKPLSRQSPLALASRFALSLAFLLILAPAGAAMADLEGAELARVEALLALLATKTDITFVRNGKEYRVDRAVSHLKTKLGRAKSRISTCSEFVEHVASGSSMSGDPYYVILPGGNTLKMRAYLDELLKELDAAAPSSPEPSE